MCICAVFSAWTGSFAQHVPAHACFVLTAQQLAARMERETGEGGEGRQWEGGRERGKGERGTEREGEGEMRVQSTAQPCSGTRTLSKDAAATYLLWC